MHQAQYNHRRSLPTPTVEAAISKQKLVRFSDVIKYSDNEIAHLHYEEDDSVTSSSCSSDDDDDDESSHEEQRWHLKVQLAPVAPMRRGSLLKNANSSSPSTLPLSPPVRKRSIPRDSQAPNLPQRRGTLEHSTLDRKQ